MKTIPAGLNWWQTDALARYLADLLSAELTRMTPLKRQPRFPWPLETNFGPAGLDLDSLEYLRLATAVTSALHRAGTQPPDRYQGLETFGAWLEEARDRLSKSSADMTFRTSGSSGAPRVAVHPMSCLEREAEFLASRLPDTGRIVSFVPAHHIYGFLFTVLLPHRLGCLVEDMRGSSPPSIVSSLQHGDLVVAVPIIWDAIAGDGRRWPKGVTGISSGAPCPLDVAERVRSDGLMRLVEIYGSSETGGIAWRDDPRAAFELFPYWTRRDDGAITKLVCEVEQTFGLPDVVTWDGSAKLKPVRRRDGAVQVAGTNVYPEFVRSVLRAHPAVSDAAVRLMAPQEGERLKAFVIPNDPGADAGSLRTDLIAWVRTRLQTPERPQSFAFGRDFARNAMGKLTDWRITDDTEQSQL